MGDEYVKILIKGIKKCSSLKTLNMNDNRLTD